MVFQSNIPLNEFIFRWFDYDTQKSYDYHKKVNKSKGDGDRVTVTQQMSKANKLIWTVEQILDEEDRPFFRPFRDVVAIREGTTRSEWQKKLGAIITGVCGTIEHKLRTNPDEEKPMLTKKQKLTRTTFVKKNVEIAKLFNVDSKKRKRS